MGGAGAGGGCTTPVGDEEVADEAGGGWGSRLSKGVGGNPRIARASANASLTEEEEVAMAQSCVAGAWGLDVGTWCTRLCPTLAAVLHQNHQAHHQDPRPIQLCHIGSCSYFQPTVCLSQEISCPHLLQ